MKNILEKKNLVSTFSFKEDLIPSLLKYIIAIISLLPGYFIGDRILLLWYLVVAFALIFKRIDIIITIFVIWAFLYGGAYHYNLVGPSRGGIFYKYLNTYIFLMLIAAYFFAKKSKNVKLTKILIFGLMLCIIAILSGVVNRVHFLRILGYLAEYFKWFFFAFILARTRLPLKKLRALVFLIFGIILINSIFGFIQQLFLPSQGTPVGYVTSYADKASGLFGATAGPYLTYLCIAAASFFIFRYLSRIGTYNLILGTLFLLQPIIAESKAAITVGGMLFVIFLLYLLIYLKVLKLGFGVPIRYTLFIILLLVSLNIYNTTYSVYGINPFQYSYSFVRARNRITDFEKINAYRDVFKKVAPSKELGLIVGIGPGRFTKTIQSAGNPFGFNPDRSGWRSSSDFRVTELSTLISELGLLGFLIFVSGMIYMFLFFLRMAKSQTTAENKIFSVFISMFIIITLWNSFYWSGMTSGFYYFPLWIFVVYFIKLNDFNKAKSSRELIE
ncbi:MAG: hypothetical protein KAW92_09500 [Candidatus Cloacimonetes bacterium]|nr:hypothetical protein [Candidatus Cloacimonadota bacterium]